MDYKKKSVAIIGGGPGGCTCAYFASKNNKVTIFEATSPLHTLLYTGGGRCNLAYAEYDFKELAKFYPRGEKFLYSVFSQFSTVDAIDFFEKIGVKIYKQDDLRIFPVSNSAREVREKILNSIKNCKIMKEKVLNIQKLDDTFEVETNISKYEFCTVVIAVGGHAGFSLAKALGHKIIEPKPSLTGLITAENFKPLQGVSLKNIKAEISYQDKKFPPLQDDLIFTHEGISGPLAYRISSICARVEYNKNNPLKLELSLFDDEINLQELLNQNSKKDIKNLLSEFIPKSLTEYILKTNCISPETKCHEINGAARDLIYKAITSFEINIISPSKEGEIVTSGGVCLDEINPKTMQSKLVDNLYFCGEVIDVDGLCGGFNLQNCWSTGYISGTNA